jgi:hypothetical protein
MKKGILTKSLTRESILCTFSSKSHGTIFDFISYIKGITSSCTKSLDTIPIQTSDFG